MGSTVKITAAAGRARVEVDGKDRSHCVTAFSVAMDANSLPEVNLRVIAIDPAGIDFTDAVVKIGGVVMPESIERALLRCLLAKYGDRL